MSIVQNKPKEGTILYILLSHKIKLFEVYNFPNFYHL